MTRERSEGVPEGHRTHWASHRRVVRVGLRDRRSWVPSSLAPTTSEEREVNRLTLNTSPPYLARVFMMKKMRAQ